MKAYRLEITLASNGVAALLDINGNTPENIVKIIQEAVDKAAKKLK